MPMLSLSRISVLVVANPFYIHSAVNLVDLVARFLHLKCFGYTINITHFSSDLL